MGFASPPHDGFALLAARGCACIPTSIPKGDESTMNFEGVDVKISDFLLSSEAFVRIGSEHRRERGFPVSGDPRSRIRTILWA